MRISYNWLKDYVELKAAPDKLANILTMAGLSVDSIEEKDNDSILEVEITSNRPDWLSYIGIAREVAAITGAKLKIPQVRHCEGAKRPKQSKKRLLRSPKVARNDSLQVSVKIEDKKLCPRYTARIIRNVRVGESPEWLKKRIESIGLRSVNNIVDITNFCLFETGEPMHAFDLDKLSGGTVIVRKAVKGEKIATIDCVPRVLDDSMLVIADSDKPVAIAGVMGGLNTEVNMSTKNILLEAAYFDQICTRRTSRKLALSTESGYRFERRVDIETIAYSSDRAAQLISETAGGEIGEFIDIGKVKKETRTVDLRQKRVNKIIGVDIPASKIRNILNSLGIKIKSSSKDAIKLTMPSFRYDLQKEIDVIEEVARIYGYDNIPETIPPIVEKSSRLSVDAIVAGNIRSVLVSLGLHEIINYSLLSRKLLNFAKISDEDIVEIKNPLSAEFAIMQPTLIIGMLNSMRWNINRKIKDLKLFELGTIYLKGKTEGFVEKESLSIGVSGHIYDGWARQPRAIGFFDLKGIVETLFIQLGAENISFKEMQYDTFSLLSSAFIEVNGEVLGIIGQIEPKILNNFDIKDSIYTAQIDIEKLTEHISLQKYFKEPIRYPAVVRDISIVVDMSILNSQIISLIRETTGQLLKDVQLIDKYRGGQIPGGKTGLTYRLEYQDPNKTLEDKDISDLHSRTVRALESNLGARLR